MSFDTKDVKGTVRNTDKTTTVILEGGKKVVLDKGETSSLLKRLDKDKSRIERDLKKK